MHVEENEEIDRAIATILIIVTFEPAGLGRNGLTHLADELHRAFVEAHHWPSGIGRLGIEVEHILHDGSREPVLPENYYNVLDAQASVPDNSDGFEARWRSLFLKPTDN